MSARTESASCLPTAERATGPIPSFDRAPSRPSNCVLEGPVHRQRAHAEAIGQRLALEELHHEKVDASLVADIVERADVWVTECGDRASLTLRTRLAKPTTDKLLILQPLKCQFRGDSGPIRVVPGAFVCAGSADTGARLA